MFTRAAPLIAHNLWQGGVAQAQASAVSAALGQCNAPLVHRGPVSIDYTTQQMKLITPTSATYNYPTYNMYPPEVLPPFPPGTNPPEELPPDRRDPFEPGGPGGPGTDGGGGGGTGGGGIGFDRSAIMRAISVGKYIHKRTGKIELDYKSDGDGNICTFSGGKIKGITPGELQEELKKWNDQNPGEGGEHGRAITVVTGIELKGDELVIHKLEGVHVIDGGGASQETIGVTRCDDPARGP